MKKEYPSIIPCFSVADTKKAVIFYHDAFGFKQANPGEDYIEMRFKDIVIMFGQEGSYDQKEQTPKHSGKPCPMVLYIYCDDVDAFYEHALKHGAKSVEKPQDTPWGDRMCSLQDLDGYTWSFAANK